MEVSRALYTALYPQCEQEEYWNENIRCDGRTFSESRSLSLTTSIVSTSSSSCLVKLGASTVLVGISLLVGTPLAIAPEDGELDITIALSPIASSEFMIGQMKDQSAVLVHWLSRILLSTPVVCLSDLCIEKGVHAWKIQMDILVIDDDGNLKDTILSGALAALKTCTLPAVDVNEEGHVEIVGKGNSLLPLHTLPISTTFAVKRKHENTKNENENEMENELILCDPLKKETAWTQASMTILYTPEGVMCGMDMTGGADGITITQMKRGMALAKARATVIGPILSL